MTILKTVEKFAMEYFNLDRLMFQKIKTVKMVSTLGFAKEYARIKCEEQKKICAENISGLNTKEIILTCKNAVE